MPAFTKTPDTVPVIPGTNWGGLNFIFDIIGFILQFIGALSSPIPAIEHAINNTWSNFIFTSAFMYNAVGALTDFLKKFLTIVFGSLAHIITDVLHGHLLKALQDIQALLRALHNLFAPLLAYLRRLQQIQRQMQMQTMRRVINAIQRARKILVLFKLLHMKWAQKLDNFLAGVEGKIIARELDIVRKTNELIGWVNLITDPFGTLRTAAVFAPFGSTLRSVFDALRAVDAQALFPGLTQVWTPVPAGVPGPQTQVGTTARPQVQTP